MKRLLATLTLLLLLPTPPVPAHAAPPVPGGSAPHPITFPADAAMHPSADVEWWYFVGHLADTAGHNYGFEVTFFKFAGLRRYFPGSSVDVAFRTDVAITDETARRFYHHITYVPMAPPRTVASTRELRLRAGAISIWTLGRLSYSLHGGLPRGSVDLAVTSLRPPMLVHGGYLKFAFGYTYYYSLTHMRAVGTLSIAGRRIPVQGLVWMDHQWGSSTGDAVRGWDWMALQLDDHTDLSLTNERTAAGVVRWAMALLPDGRQIFVPGALITPLGRWRSPTTGVVYSSGWRVRVPGLRLDVVVRPTVRDQEMADSLAVSGYRSSYWEGSDTVAGTRAGHQVTGKAYTELTGYGTPPPSLHVQP